MVGSATVARLHADPAFHADLSAAGAELVALRAGGVARGIGAAVAKVLSAASSSVRRKSP